MVTKKIDLDSLDEMDVLLTPAYGRRSMTWPTPKYKLPEHEMAPDSVYDIIHDELMLDGNARLNMATFTLNFSRPVNQIVGQYYNFLRLRRAGYSQIMRAIRDIATGLCGDIAKLGPFELVSDGSAIPVSAFKLK